MSNSLAIEEFLGKAATLPVIDVRSDTEYAHAHIPGAFSLPLFLQSERARVGTVYKQEGRERAIETGLEIVGPKLAGFIQQAKGIIKNKEALVHCWRGGMRSSSMAWLLETYGYRIWTLAGGYKSFRKFVSGTFITPYKFILLGGKTGSGKTGVLKELLNRGEQVIDLEALCCHKGSSFGALGQNSQPSCEHFENMLALELQRMNPRKRIWLEDESRNLGTVFLPDAFWKQMLVAPVIFVEVDKQTRIQNLVKDYAIYPKEQLAAAIERIKSKPGGANYKLALDSLKQSEFDKVADICLAYYDKAYTTGIKVRAAGQVNLLEVTNTATTDLPAAILKEANRVLS